MRDASPSPRLKDRLLRNWGDLTAVEGNMIAAGGTSLRTVMVVSAADGDGRTSAAACLALALSAAGRTLLIDGHLRKPDLSSRFTAPGLPGLSEAVLDGQDLASLQQQIPEAENLYMLPAGLRRSGGAMLFRSAAFVRLMGLLRQDWDYVVCDTPPFLADSDASLMAAQFDGAVMVLSCGDSRWQVAATVAERLEAAGGHAIGAVLNRRRYYVPALVYRWL